MCFQKPKNLFILNFFALAVVLILAGCATSKGTIDSFSASSYETGGIQTLAIPRLRNSSAAPSQAQKVTREITRAVKQKNPQVRIITPNEFNRLLNDEHLVGNYADFLEDYSTSGIANRDFTKHLADAGVDGILIGMLNRVRQVDGRYGGNKGQTRVTLNFGIVDTHRNDVIWSATADGIKGTHSTVGDAPPIARAVALAMDKVESNVPNL